MACFSTKRYMRYIFLCVIFIFVSGCAQHPSRPGITLRDIYRMHQRAVAYNRSITALQGSGYFSWKDAKDDFHFLVRIRYDRKQRFTRVELRGTLDEAYWADLVVSGDSVQLYMPLQKRLYTGSRAGFDLYPFTGIRIKLEQLLPLMQGKYFLLHDAALQGGRVAGEEARLTAVSGQQLLQTGFALSTGKPVRSRLFAGRKLQGELQYLNRRSLNGLELAAKRVLQVFHPVSGTAVLWFSAWSTNYRYADGDGIISAASNVRPEILR